MNEAITLAAGKVVNINLTCLCRREEAQQAYMVLYPAGVKVEELVREAEVLGFYSNPIISGMELTLSA